MRINILAISFLVLSLFLSSCFPVTTSLLSNKKVENTFKVDEIKSSKIKFPSSKCFLKWVYRKDEEEGLKSQITFTDGLASGNGYIFLSQHTANKEDFLDLFVINENGEYKFGKSYKDPKSNFRFGHFFRSSSATYLVLEREIKNTESFSIDFIPLNENNLSLDFAKSNQFNFEIHSNGLIVNDDSVFIYGYVSEDIGNDKSLQKPYIAKFVEKKGVITIESTYMFQYPFFGYHSENEYGAEIESLVVDEQENLFFFTDKGYMGKLNAKCEFQFIKKIPGLSCFVNSVYVKNKIIVQNSKSIFSFDANGNLLNQYQYPIEWKNNNGGFTNLFPISNGLMVFGDIVDSDYEEQKDIVLHLSNDLNNDFMGVIDGIFFYPEYFNSKEDAFFVCGQREIDEPSKIYRGYNGNCIGFMQNSISLKEWLEPYPGITTKFSKEEIDNIWASSNQYNIPLTKNKNGEFTFNGYRKAYTGKDIVIQEKNPAVGKRGISPLVSMPLTKLIITDKPYTEFSQPT